MPNTRKSQDQQLKHIIYTRVNDAKYAELQGLLLTGPKSDMSSLLRKIIYKQPVRVFTKDKTLDDTMHELSKLRMEIKAIGVNINQITKTFNTYPEPKRKALYAAMAFKQHQSLEPKIRELLSIIGKLSERWLSG